MASNRHHLIAEEALRESEEKFRLVFSISPDAISITCISDGRYIEVNQGFLDLLGYTREEVIGKTSIELMIWERPEERKRLFDQVYQQGYVSNFETCFIIKGGKRTTGLVSARIFDIRGVPHLLAFTRDISERKKAEEEINKAEYRFRALIENAPDGVVLVSSEGTFKYVSPSASKHFRYNEADILTFQPNDLTHPDDLPMVLGNLGKLIADPSFIPVLQYRFRSGDGDWRWIESTFKNLLTVPGVESIVINFRDITEKKLAELALLQSEARLSAFMKHVPALILIKDQELRPVFANEKFYDLFPIDQWMGKKPHELFHSEVADLMVEKDTHALNEGYVSYEETWKDKEGVPHTYHTQKFRIDIPGSSPLLGLIISDITEQKGAEEVIRALNQSLEKRVQMRTTELTASNKELEAFAYTVSHDLRAPVRAIGGFTRILQEDYLSGIDEEGKRLFNVIIENTRRMEFLIDDLLSFSRLSRADMNFSVISLAEISRMCFGELTRPETRNRISLEVSDLPLVHGDYPMIVQAMTNLLSNAIKYTSHREHPEIAVGWAREGDEYVFSVKDNGIGFDMKYADKLFGVFQRLHSAKEYEGTGVGLAIVQRIIQRYGGRIWADAEPGKGAAFYFTLK